MSENGKNNENKKLIESFWGDQGIENCGDEGVFEKLVSQITDLDKLISCWKRIVKFDSKYPINYLAFIEKRISDLLLQNNDIDFLLILLADGLSPDYKIANLIVERIIEIINEVDKDNLPTCFLRWLKRQENIFNEFIEKAFLKKVNEIYKEL